MSFKSGVILILLSAAAWGLGGVCGQYLYQFHAVTAPWLIAVRQVLAGLIFLGYLLLRGENIFRIFADKRDAKDQLAFSFLGLLGAQFGFYYTISLCNAATATVLQYTSPVFVMLWMSFKSRSMPEGRELCAGRRVFNLHTWRYQQRCAFASGAGDWHYLRYLAGVLHGAAHAPFVKVQHNACRRLGAAVIGHAAVHVCQSVCTDRALGYGRAHRVCVPCHRRDGVKLFAVSGRA